MRRRLWIDIAKHNAKLVLKHKFAGYFTRNDFAEKTIRFSHKFLDPQAQPDRQGGLWNEKSEVCRDNGRFRQRRRY